MSPSTQRQTASAHLPMFGMVASVTAYALAVWWSNRHSSWLALVLAVLPFVWLAAAFALDTTDGQRRWQRALPLLLLCATLALSWQALLANVQLVYLAQHLGAHMALAWMFGCSLRPGKVPLCTEFASWVHSDMETPGLRRYTRIVTQVWTFFFAAMSLASVLLYVLSKPAQWTMFSAILGPTLTGALFLAENMARRYFLPPQVRLGLADTWRGVRAHMAAKASKVDRQPRSP